MFFKEPIRKGEIFSELVRARAEDDGIPFREALAAVAEERPDLLREAKQEIFCDTLHASNLSSGDSRPDITFVKMTEERAEKKQITFREAFSEISHERPELARRYREFVLRGR